jgi:hypothetical protein
MTPEKRRQDSADCGGGASDSPGFNEKKVEKARRPGETWLKAYGRLFDDWDRCMLKKGYRFTGKCYDNEVSKAKPACGAP